MIHDSEAALKTKVALICALYRMVACDNEVEMIFVADVAIRCPTSNGASSARASG